MAYHHTQRGVWIMAAMLTAALLAALIAWRSGQWSPLLILIVPIAAAVVFSSLTVDVNAGELRWHFGPGFGTTGFRSATSRMWRWCGTTGGTVLVSGCARGSGFTTCRAWTRSSCG